MSLRNYTCILILATAPGWTAAFADQPPVEAFAPLSQDAVGTILTPGSAVVATELATTPQCHPTKYRAALVGLRWQPTLATDPENGSTTAQRVELTKFRDGFSTGRFVATRQLAGEIEAVAVDSPETGVHYYWRVLTLTPDGWSPSEVARFEVPICPWDEPDLSQFETKVDEPTEATRPEGTEEGS